MTSFNKFKADIGLSENFSKLPQKWQDILLRVFLSGVVVNSGAKYLPAAFSFSAAGVAAGVNPLQFYVIDKHCKVNKLYDKKYKGPKLPEIP